ncbi:MAG TPA: bifunctional SulP family inorganic anion transporter/carbonic anhydrase, partial [Gammaproteobacteria bacterium]|nr:bifunctional SulP family inorganic anion transporter/carbonic anhydrase [Gammaproteobacteria bacterium]
MVNLLNYQRLSLGVSQLTSEWKKLLTRKYFLQDLSAGMTVAFVSIPLSLAIALASNVPPATGLITAIVAGIVCALFGGSALSVSGPAAAMSVLIADIVQKFGLEALILIGMVAGVMQLISGILGLGRLGRYVPMPVISGFTAGIGVIILIGQLPRAFGLMPPAESHVIDIFNHIKEYIHETNGMCLFLVVTTVAIIRVLPKITSKISPILPAVVIASAIAYFANLSVPLIGDIPRTLPVPNIPQIGNMTVTDLLLNAFTIYLLASLETLLSCNAIDRLTNDKKHDSDQELIGQGLGNIAVSLFGGIPVTAVIVRSATNVRAGAKTRRAAIINALIILVTVYFIAPIISLIPIAVLAGVLFCVAASMINYHGFKDLWQTSRAEGLIYAVTLLTIISVDLLAGVKAGIIAACCIMMWKAAKTNLHVSDTSEDNILRFSVTGSLTFLSSGSIEKLESKLENLTNEQIVLLDMSGLTNLDSSGAAAIVDLFKSCQERGIKFYIKGLATRFEPLIKMCSLDIENCFVTSEHELRKIDASTAPASSRGRLVHGVYRFYTEREENDKRLFEQIKKTQNPHTLFITCADSRMVPTLITSSDPGELFTVRNVGNAVPPYNPNWICSEAAAIEFSLASFDITDLVICGHANCGAIKACMQFDNLNLAPQLKSWVQSIKSQLSIDRRLSQDHLAQVNVLNQV